MNDADSYYRELEQRRSTIRPERADAVDLAAAAIGEPLSTPDVERV